MEKPLIGVVEWPYYDKDNDQIYEVMIDIIRWVNYMGGVPIGIFPPQTERYIDKKIADIDTMNADETMSLIEICSKCDAIIKPGATRIYDHERFIYDYAYNQNTPYLGICAGMQMMASHGGKVDNVLNEKNHVYPVEHSNGIHTVKIYPNTLLSDILKKKTTVVHSKHKYHIATPGIHKVSAVAEDGVIEAIENPNCDYNLGLQWHPELEPLSSEDGQNICGSLVERAKVYKKRR